MTEFLFYLGDYALVLVGLVVGFVFGLLYSPFQGWL